MRVLYACYTTPGHGGGGGGGRVFYAQNIRSLVELGHEVHALVLSPSHELEAEVKNLLSSLTYADAVQPNRRQLDWLLSRVFRQETSLLRFSGWQGLEAQAMSCANRVDPELCWFDWIGTLAICPPHPRIVYGHLDFMYMLKRVRARLGRGRLTRPDPFTQGGLQRFEAELCKKAKHVASVSATDLSVLKTIGVPATYVPVCGDPVPPLTNDVRETPRCFFFGRNNTAMNASRREFRTTIHPKLPQPLPISLHQLGAPPAQEDSDWKWLCQHFERHGFVDDLGTVFQPGDLCMVPYRDDTGFRAKFVVAASYGLVNIAFRESFDAAPEFVPGENCLGAESPEHFAELLVEYGRDAEMRRRLARASRELYDNSFTIEALRPKYETILNAVQ